MNCIDQKKIMNGNPLLSIVILSWNGQSLIKQNLDSIMKVFDREKYELIVVDNGSTDKTLEILKEYPEIKLIKNEKNLGFAKGCNIGIERAEGKYILLLNQDVECVDDAIGEMVKFLDKNNEYGAVAPQLLYPNGKVQISCRPFYDWKTYVMELLTFGKYKDNFYDHSKSQEVDQPMASVLMIRGELLKKLGGLDDHPNFWLYFNDVDLSYRIHKEGYKHYLLAETKFYHHHGTSGYSLKDFKRTWLWHKGLKRFFLKHIIKRKISFQYLFLLILMFFSYTVLNISLIFKIYRHKNKEK